MENGRTFNRLDAIMEHAGKLTVENQELILAVIRGMLFTRRLLTKPKEKEQTVKENTNHFSL